MSTGIMHANLFSGHLVTSLTEGVPEGWRSGGHYQSFYRYHSFSHIYLNVEG